MTDPTRPSTGQGSRTPSSAPSLNEIPVNLTTKLTSIDQSLQDLPGTRARSPVGRNSLTEIARSYDFFVSDLLDMRDLASQLASNTLPERAHARVAYGRGTRQEYLSQERDIIHVAFGRSADPEAASGLHRHADRPAPGAGHLRRGREPRRGGAVRPDGRRRRPARVAGLRRMGQQRGRHLVRRRAVHTGLVGRRSREPRAPDPHGRAQPGRSDRHHRDQPARRRATAFPESRPSAARIFASRSCRVVGASMARSLRELLHGAVGRPVLLPHAVARCSTRRCAPDSPFRSPTRSPSRCRFAAATSSGR